MDGKRKYLRCSNLSGEGTFCDNLYGRAKKFEVINLSASGMLIKSKRKLEINDVAEMKIVFGGYINEKQLRLSGRVVRIESSGDNFLYGMEFVEISHGNRVEIDEIMNMTCSREHQNSLKNCDHGECTFLR